MFSVKGVYKDGKIELVESLPLCRGGDRMLETGDFLCKESKERVKKDND